MRDHEREIEEAGASLAAIGTGGRRYASSFRQETGIAFPLLVDLDGHSFVAAGLEKGNVFHLLRGDNFSARRQAKAEGHRQHGLGRDPWQLGGSFVFAPGDVDLFVHRSKTFGDNASPQAILAALHAT